MKKLFFLCLSILLLFALSACGSSQADTPLKVQNEAKGVELSVGMTKEAAEDTLTSHGIDPVSVEKPTEPCLIWSAIYGRGEDKVTVWYNGKTDVIDQIMIDPISEGDYNSHWSLDGSISLGSSKNDILQAYGTSSMENNAYLAYYYDTNGSKPNGDAIVGFILDEAGQTEYFYVCTMT